MKNPAVRLIARVFLVTLSILSAWFLGALALADPRCANCSINLVLWAMPRAEILTGAWIVAGAGYTWSIRSHIAAFCSSAWQVLRHSSVPRGRTEEG